jgi:ribosomal protein S18 acetylase RimI-like enzyme
MKRYRLIEDRDIQGVIGLWERCKLTRPWNDPVTDIAFARRGPSSDVLVWEQGGSIVATVMVGHDGHRGQMYYVGVEPTLRKTGLGREVVQSAEQWLTERGVWKVNLLVRDDNDEALGFYDRLGYSSAPVKSLQKPLKR